jgi:hypothetical protein
MAIYNPKRARELEAAARLAESQRQRELAKGQREQRSTEQILGLVEGLIGAAPQVVGGLQDVQAQQVLAGERPLPEQKPKSDDILENIGRFITDPFEAGVRQKARAMAQEQKGARLQAAEPLLREAIQKPGVKEPAKFKGEPEVLGAPYADFGAVKEPGVPYAMEPEVKFTPREAAMKQLMRDPALAMLPEREREAAIAGLQQRMTAEQAAAEREAEEFGLRKSELEARKAAAEAKKAAAERKEGAKLDVNTIAGSIQIPVGDITTELREQLNSTDEQVATEARQQVNQMAEDQAKANGYDVTDASVRAGIAKAIGQAYKSVDMKPLSEKSIKEYAVDADAINSLVRLDALRKKAGWSPDKAEVLKQYVVDNLNLPFNLESVLQLGRNGFIRAGLTAEDYNYMAEAQIARQKMALAVFKGTGAVSENERSSVEPFVLTPWSTEEEWDLRFRTTVQTLASPFVSEVLAQKEVSKVPAELISKAERFGLYVDPNEYDAAIEGILQEAAAPQFGKDRPKRLQQADQVKMLGSALADSPQILAKSLPEFTKTMIATARDIGVDLAEEQLEKLAPMVFGLMSSLSGGAAKAGGAAKTGGTDIIKVKVTYDDGTFLERSGTRQQIEEMKMSQPPEGMKKIVSIEEVTK